MSLEIIAIIISVFSALLAVFSLGWNVYRDVILKPKVNVYFAVKHLVSSDQGRQGVYLCVTATNFGPGEVIITNICAREYSLWRKLCRKVQMAVIWYDHRIWAGGVSLPKRLKMAEEVLLFLPYDKECLLKDKWTHVGVCDTFGRLHWATPNQVEVARKQWGRDFGGNGRIKKSG